MIVIFSGMIMKIKRVAVALAIMLTTVSTSIQSAEKVRVDSGLFVNKLKSGYSSQELSGGSTFSSVESFTLANGKTKVKHQQYYAGIPVLGASVVTTLQGGLHKEAYGFMVKGINADIIDVKPTITPQEAIIILKNRNPNHSKNSIEVTSASQRQQMLIPKSENEQSKLVIILDEKRLPNLLIRLAIF